MKCLSAFIGFLLEVVVFGAGIVSGLIPPFIALLIILVALTVAILWVSWQLFRRKTLAHERQSLSRSQRK